MSAERQAGIDALARDIAERASGMPAYLVDDEMWAAALDEAEATYQPPKPETPIQRAVRRARGDLVGVQPVEAIKAYNRGVSGESDVEITDLGDGRYEVRQSPLRGRA